MTEWQKDRKTERQKDRKIEWQKDRKTERQKDRMTEWQKDRKTERQKDRKTERQKANGIKCHINQSKAIFWFGWKIAIISSLSSIFSNQRKAIAKGQIRKQTTEETDKCRNRQMKKQTNLETDKWRNRQI